MSETKTNLKDLTKEDIVKLSPEELQEFRDLQVKVLEDQFPYLEAQAKYSKLKADIAENNLRETMSKMKHASLMNKPKEEKT